MLSILKSFRPKQWTKNLLVFAAPFFSFTTINEIWFSAFIGFISFCLASSSIYLLNDVLDLEDGPFEIIEGTNCIDNFDEKNYIDKIKFRISNSYTEKNYKNSIKTVYGKEGTIFLADTRAFHRGNVIIKDSHRIVLMLYYSTHLFGKEKKIC